VVSPAYLRSDDSTSSVELPELVIRQAGTSLRPREEEVIVRGNQRDLGVNRFCIRGVDREHLAIPRTEGGGPSSLHSRLEIIIPVVEDSLHILHHRRYPVRWHRTFCSHVLHEGAPDLLRHAVWSTMGEDVKHPGAQIGVPRSSIVANKPLGETEMERAGFPVILLGPQRQINEAAELGYEQILAVEPNPQVREKRSGTIEAQQAPGCKPSFLSYRQVWHPELRANNLTRDATLRSRALHDDIGRFNPELASGIEARSDVA